MMTDLTILLESYVSHDSLLRVYVNDDRLTILLELYVNDDRLTILLELYVNAMTDVLSC